MVLPATSATAERSFSALRRLKTWMRSTMSQGRLNGVAILHVHRDRVQVVQPTEVAKDFVAPNASRRHTFSPF